MLKKILLSLLAFLILLTICTAIYLSRVNHFKRNGKLKLDILTEEVTITRDENGIPYIHAQNLADLIRGQGFVMGQDRVFQIELYRAIIAGRLSALVGEAGWESDVQMLVLGLYKNAARHAAQLDDNSREYLEWLAEGYNAYLTVRANELPIEFKLLGFKPNFIEVVDLMAVQHFMGFTHSQNYEDEILSLNLTRALGAQKAAALFPLNINPDRQQAVLELWQQPDKQEGPLGLLPPGLKSQPWVPTSMPTLGSNNWVVNGEKSISGKPIMVNDPHLDATILPGPWFPVGLFAPGIQAVGATIPGVPGILVGRTKHLAFGVTNAYGDSQDLYLETSDPIHKDQYLDENGSLPYQTQILFLNVKDRKAPGGFRPEQLTIRSTKRGPILSDHAQFGLDPNQPVSLRWTLAETAGKTIGLDRLLMAKNVTELDTVLADIDILYFNFVFADVEGNIGHRTTGQIPIRKGHQGAFAKKPEPGDDWLGFIPKKEMPGQVNPTKNWVGTANHDVRPDHFPYYYSSHFAPNYRYERISELLARDVKLGPEDHWENVQDVTNPHARRLTPTLLAALEQDELTKPLADKLKNWDFRDHVDAVEASIFHLLHEDLVRLILKDDLPEALFEHFLSMRYYWLQRIDEWIVEGDTTWFDNTQTPEVETLDDLIIAAGKSAQARLSELLGPNMDKWTWGALHHVIFVSPIRTKGTGRDWVGGGEYPANGSGETINRGQYELDRGPYESKWFSSMRMVADLADQEKIRAVISGGNAARQFHPYFTSQLDAWVKGEALFWWLDPAKAEEHAVHRLRLRRD
ncbi:MAG: penicillin acylase family protein [Saprospiraceae bacterium]